MEERGSVDAVAAVVGMTSRSVERARSGRAGPRLVARLRLASEGEVWDQAREERLRLYEQRAAAARSVFDGSPATDAVSVAQLASEADQEEFAAALGVRTRPRPAWAV
ncbi:MAG: hypothetical protein KIT58_04465 [Planctomycetota bacterium]|nr:hypothetical protein [Planctomycetota bacterium]